CCSFFFQAEDGIRDRNVTGVQTCALPILAGGVSITYETTEKNPSSEDMADTIYKLQQRVEQYSTESQVYQEGDNRITVEIPGVKIGRASCRERVEIVDEEEE